MYRDLPSAGEDRLPIATEASEQILCLPFYHDLAEDDQNRLVDVIRSSGLQIEQRATGVNL